MGNVWIIMTTPIKILGFFKQRWLLTLLGVVTLSLFIWFLGPLFAFASFIPFEAWSNRSIAIGVVLLIWSVSRIFAFFKARKENEAIIAALFPTEQATRDEVKTLKERMENALGDLKKTRLGGASGRQILYQLPWYLIIGPPCSGKTTLLQNSQIRFPFTDHFGDEAIRRVGGTRNCDWWFAENAMLLDTTGRYTTQDSQKEVDRGAWFGLLNLLKKHRRWRPINGTIIAVSLSELLESNEALRKVNANAIRNRIFELYETLGIRFPVYLIFTKFDLMAGFIDYFDDLDSDARTQVWGMTFPLSEDPNANPIALFEKEFELLEQHLLGPLVDKLERERNSERRARIYTFPQQFVTLKPLLLKFAEDLFEPKRFQPQAMLRGLYFTSATQVGSPIDSIMGSLEKNFGVERQALVRSSGSGKSFFIYRLLAEVIFGESGLAGTNLKLERKRAWLQRGVLLATAALSALIVLAWVVSYTRNKAYVREVEEKAAVIERMANELPPKQTDVFVALPLLNSARALAGGYSDQRREIPWSMTYGFYQGDKLGKASVSLYRRLLDQAFLPRLMARLEQQIGDKSANMDYLFKALKVYLMLDDPKHYHADTIRAWIMLDLDHNFPNNVTNLHLAKLADHLDALLERGPLQFPFPLDSALVDNARTVLLREPLVDRVYGRLKLELANSNVPDFRISEAAGHEAPLVFARKSNAPLNEGIPGLFTYDGYYELFLPQIRQLSRRLDEESWVLGTYQVKLNGEELAVLNDDVQKRYLDDFIREWETLLSDIRVAHFSNLAQVVQTLYILSGYHSPLRTLLQAVEKETTLGREPEEEKSLAFNSGEKISRARAMLGSVIGSAPSDPTDMVSRFGVHFVSNKFKRLNELTRSENGEPPLEHILAVLNELYVYLNSILISGDELVLEQHKQVNQIIQKVKTEAKRQPVPVSNLLKSIAEGSANIVGGGRE
jgi:type VI secretion system protein ImpL